MIRILKEERKKCYKTRYEKRAFTMYKRNKKKSSPIFGGISSNSLKLLPCPQQAASIQRQTENNRSHLYHIRRTIC